MHFWPAANSRFAPHLFVPAPRRTPVIVPRCALFRRPTDPGGPDTRRSSTECTAYASKALQCSWRACPVDSVGDSYDNSLAETIKGLYKAEVIHRRGPWRSLDAVEYATLEWVDWFNNPGFWRLSAMCHR